MRTMTWLTLLAAALCCLGPADGGWCKFQAVFNFGDSNSDTGGYWAMFPWQQTPYGMTYFHKGSGRASDGRLVIDFIVQSMGMPFLSPYLKSVGSDYHHGVNFATMGATALQPKSFVTGLSPWYLGIQLNQMKEFANRVMSANGNNGQLPSLDVFGNSLYTIDIGQNDFTSSLAYESIESAKQNLPTVVNQISWTIQDLYKSVGARNFLVFNMAPVGCYPAFLAHPHNTNDLDEYGCAKIYNDAVGYYNQLLMNSLAEVRNTLQDASIVYVDKHTVMLELFQHLGAHGLKYGTRACCGYGGGAYNYNSEVTCGNSKVVNGQTVTATACQDPQDYVSWDGVHATEAANQLIASAVTSGSYTYPSFDLSKICQTTG